MGYYAECPNCGATRVQVRRRIEVVEIGPAKVPANDRSNLKYVASATKTTEKTEKEILDVHCVGCFTDRGTSSERVDSADIGQEVAWRGTVWRRGKYVVVGGEGGWEVAWAGVELVDPNSDESIVVPRDKTVQTFNEDVYLSTGDEDDHDDA